MTAVDGERLMTLAAVAGMSEGAYAAQIIEEHLRARWRGELTAEARRALGIVVERATPVAGLGQEVAAVGRLLNQITRHVNSHGQLPPGSALARVAREVEVLAMRVTDTLTELDAAAAALRGRL
ncbi:hypothetical protein [Actinokineospora sp. HUAS TT18]|uniref:hypothetical protein n=1 Tax=Actinokineospora sp. HUAS TT18 TaxID=3447451 RepID=UPI003F52001F